MSLLASGFIGFHNAPVTKMIIYTCASLNIVAAMLGSRREGTLQFGYEKFNGDWKQSWKLLTAPFICSSIVELMFSLILLYVFRVFERFYGSQKYTVFVLYSTLSSLFFLLFYSLIMQNLTGIENVSYYWKSGPFGLIFASVVIYYHSIPATTTYVFSRTSPLTFTEKHLVYLLAVQLMLGSGYRSFPISLFGLLSGIIYVNSPALRQLKPPAAISAWFTKHVFPLINSASIRTSATAANNRLNRQRQQRIFGQFDANTPTRGRSNTDPFADNLLGDNSNGIITMPTTMQARNTFTPQPETATTASANNVQSLVDMGFDRQEAINALNATNDNLQEATEMLLAGN